MNFKCYLVKYLSSSFLTPATDATFDAKHILLHRKTHLTVSHSRRLPLFRHRLNQPRQTVLSGYRGNIKNAHQKKTKNTQDKDPFCHFRATKSLLAQQPLQSQTQNTTWHVSWLAAAASVRTVESFPRKARSTPSPPTRHMIVKSLNTRLLSTSTSSCLHITHILLRGFLLVSVPQV